MRIFLLIFCLFSGFSYADFSFKGDFDYMNEEKSDLSSNNEIRHLIKIYENKDFLVTISNALSVDLDCFRNEIKETSVFTTLKVEF